MSVTSATQHRGDAAEMAEGDHPGERLRNHAKGEIATSAPSPANAAEEIPASCQSS